MDIDIYEEIKQIIKSQQDKRDKEFLKNLNGRDKKRFKSMEDVDKFVDSILDNKPKKSEEEKRKNIIDITEIEKDGFTFGIVTTKSRFKDYKSLEDLGEDVPTVTLYRTYLILNKGDDIIDNLFYKQYKTKNPAIKYHNELIDYVNKTNTEDILKKIRNILDNVI